MHVHSVLRCVIHSIMQQSRGGWNVSCFAVRVHCGHHVADVPMYVMKLMR